MWRFVGEVNLWEMSPSHPLGPLLSGSVYSLLFAGNVGDAVISSRFMDPLDVYGTGKKNSYTCRRTFDFIGLTAA